MLFNELKRSMEMGDTDKKIEEIATAHNTRPMKQTQQEIKIAELQERMRALKQSVNKKDFIEKSDSENFLPSISESNEKISIPKDYVPRYALREAWRYKKDFLQKKSKSASDLTYRFFYDEEENACLEFTVKPKTGYTFKKLTWVGCTWSNTCGYIGNGKIKFSLTKKLSDKAQYYMDERRKDFVFKEIEKAVLKIAKNYQYDFQSAYGISVKYRRPNIKKAVCGGYSDAVAEALKNHPLISKVESWSSAQGNHAWNVIILKNKQRKLYCDATWYQGNNIDEEGYVVDIPEQNPVNLTFNFDEFNSLGGAINTATGKLLEVHFAWPDVKI